MGCQESLKTAAALLHLLPAADSRQHFEEYFAHGIGVSETMKYHTSVLELRSNMSEALLADGSVNPKYSTVRWWYDEWRRCNLEPRTGPAVLKVLEEKLESYRELGHRVALLKDPFAVVIVTSIIQRANALREASQIAFVDSMASCDCENHSLTFILAPCFAGAVPLGILITTSQSTAEYNLAFSLFKAFTETDFFGGIGHPLTFVTDDSDAAGRPPMTALERQKRQHDLSLNVELNQPNVKQHGKSH